jgi:hypothetical protein
MLSSPSGAQTNSWGSIEDWQIPHRYRRKDIGPDEVAYINVSEQNKAFLARINE